MNGLGRGEKKEEKKFSVVTRETVGMTLLLFSIIIFFIAVTGRFVFGDIGTAITAFFVGLSGFFVYPLLLLVIYFSLVLVSGKKLLPAGWIVKGLLFMLSVFFIVHTATAERFVALGYGKYLAGCWNAAAEGAAKGTGGGVLFGLIAFPVRYLLSEAGAYIIFSLCLILSVFYIFTATPLWKKIRNAPRKKSEAAAPRESETRGAVAFDDLEPTVVPNSSLQDAPRAQERQAPAPAPVYEPAPAPDPYADSRNILFRGDRADNYTKNLIFNENSAFNRTNRASTIQPIDDRGLYPATPRPSMPPAQPVAPTQLAQPYRAPSVPESYSGKYAADAETTRSPMPKRVAGTDGGYYPLDDTLNYPKAPSYRAPEASGEKRSFSEPLNTPAPARNNPPPAEDDGVYAVPQDPRDLPAGHKFGEEPAAPPKPSGRSSWLHGYLSESAEERLKNTPPLRAAEEPAEPVRPVERPTEPVRPVERPAERPSEPVRPVEPVRPAERPSEPARPIEPAIEPVRPVEPVREPKRDDPYTLRTPEPNPFDDNEGIGLSSEDNVYSDRSPRAGRLRDREDSVSGLFDDDGTDDQTEPAAEEPMPSTRATRGLERSERRLEGSRGTRFEAPAGRAPAPDPAPAPAPVKREKYVCPSTDSLFVYDETITVTDDEVENNVAVILDTLKGFNVEATFKNAKRGPAVTQYNIDIPRNVSVSAVTRRDAEIAMRLHAKSGINIYSNPMAEAISIEVPNAKSTMVSMRSVMEAEEYKNPKPDHLVFTMGKSIEGKPVCGDIVSMKHILMAGATGSGKSVMMNAMLISLLCKYSPEDLRLILIDPKKVEFGIYEGIPHLMIKEVIADEKKVVAALSWAVGEMERRYSLFEKKVKSGVNVRAIDEYNQHLEEGEEKLPKLVIVIDELADLMAVVAKDIEVYIQRIAQKARAAGIHLVLATQRPSADIITGVIKANLPTRIAFHVAQEINSRIILDETGADKLLGNGDMLYKTEKMTSCQRLQGVFIDSPEVEAIIRDIKAHNKAYYDQSVDDAINKNRSSGGDEGDDDKDVNEEYIKALRVAVNLGQASISLIQRKCSVGYNHAGKIIEWMEAKGYITPFDGKAKARTVLLTKEEFEELYGGLD